MPKTESRPLTCRLNIKHHWQNYTEEDGTRYRACSKCGRMLAAGGVNFGS